MVAARRLERLGDVGHHGHDVVRLHPLRLRDEGRLPAVAVADLQSGLRGGLPVEVGAALERAHRRGVDHDALRRGPRRRACARRHRALRADRRGRLHQLRLSGDGQVLQGLPAVGSVARDLRRHHHVDHRRLRRPRRDAERGADGLRAVHPDGPVERRHRRRRDDERRPRTRSRGRRRKAGAASRSATTSRSTGRACCPR